MHLLTAKTGRIDTGEEAVDLEQTPGDIVILSAADSELTGFTEVVTELSEGSALNIEMPNGMGLSFRLANIMQLSHPYSIDLYVEKTLSQTRFIFLRLLGGVEYWRYGLERLEEIARAEKIALVVAPGDEQWDESLARHSTVPLEIVRQLWRYCVEGGYENLKNALKTIIFYLGYDSPPSACKSLPRYGFLMNGRVMQSFEDIHMDWHEPTGPIVPIVFYRSLVQAATIEPVRCLEKALEKRGINALPIFVSSLKDEESAAFIDRCFAESKPAVVLNSTAFSLSKAGAPHMPTPLDRQNSPVLQVVFSGTSREAWLENPRGLSMRDLTMHVVLPEIDGRILTRAVSFKEQEEWDELTQFRPVRYKADHDRIAFVAEQAKKWVALASKNSETRKVAFIFANYPNRDGRIANGVGLDTPASALTIIEALRTAGYYLDDQINGDTPKTVEEMMGQLLQGPTNALHEREERLGGVKLQLSDYKTAFEELPICVQRAVNERWGVAEKDPFVTDKAFHLALHVHGHLVIGIQPARGYNIDPKETYHDPDLVPPHNYFAFYIWLKSVYDIDAIIHLGKHGNLEWLPGKALALSNQCFPEAVLGAVPNIYPFIVNDPGEGCQAKRRTSAVIVDHLTPPMTRAESHGFSLELETLLDEYYLAESVDPRRAHALKEEIFNLTSLEGFNKDVGIENLKLENKHFDKQNTDVQTEALARIDAHLCDLKELQIRDGLHVLGQAPEGRLLDDLIVAIARIPRGETLLDQSLHRALAHDLGLIDFDPLDCDFSISWCGVQPAILARQTPDVWRSYGDTVERIEMLAAKLVAGEEPIEPTWHKTQAVLEWIEKDLRPKIQSCGVNELQSILKGLAGAFVAPGPSGAPSRGRVDTLPTGRNFYAVDVRAVPSQTAWRLGALSAERLVERYFQEEGEWPRSLVLTCWGTSNMRTGGDDIAQALALIGVKPQWEAASGRVSGFEIMRLSDLKRPRIDVTLRISGFFRDAFPHQIDLFDSAVRAVANLNEDESANPISAHQRAEAKKLIEHGLSSDEAKHVAGFRIFGSMPGAYGAGLQTLIDEKTWERRADFATAFLKWGGFAYGAGINGEKAEEQLETRLRHMDAVVQNQDNREHDLLDSDDYYQFEGGLAATIETLKGTAPRIFHNDHSRPERPVIRTLEEEIARVVRGRAANPKWIAGVMRHGYKGAFEIAATLDYLFAFAATTNAVRDHHFDQLFDAYVKNDEVRDFLENNNRAALCEIAERFEEAIERGLWGPRSNSVHQRLNDIKNNIKGQMSKKRAGEK